MPSNYNPDSVNAVLSRIETKLEDISSELKEIKKSNSTLEKRISILEQFKYYLVGVAAFFVLGIDYVRDFFKR
jgi:prefoldin subunit 5